MDVNIIVQRQLKENKSRIAFLQSGSPRFVFKRVKRLYYPSTVTAVGRNSVDGQLTLLKCMTEMIALQEIR